jgi:predicted O-linked N-acetylglucosamine transferase (SPINDLY family)
MQQSSSMDKFLLAPKSACVEDIVDTFNIVQQWIDKDDCRINISKAILECIQQVTTVPQILTQVHGALACIANIQEDYMLQLKHSVYCIYYDNTNEIAYMHMYDCIGNVFDADLFDLFLEHMSIECPYFHTVLLTMYTYMKNRKYQQHTFADKIIRRCNNKYIRDLLCDTHATIVSQSREEEHHNMQVFLQAIHKVCASDENLQHIQVFFEENPRVIMPKIGFYLTYSPWYSVEIPQKISFFYRSVFPYIEYTSRHIITKARPTSRWKRRIGIICAFLRDHSIGTMFGGMVRNLDRNLFEVYLYNINNNCTKYEEYVDVLHEFHLSETMKTTILKCQKQIEEDDLDLLIYPEIAMDTTTYYLSFARLAHTQVVWWGHPESPSTNIDYFLSSQHFDDRQEQYSETLLKMRTLSVVYSRVQEKPNPLVLRKDIGIPSNMNVYMCMQTFFKYATTFDDALQGILDADPNAYIVILDATNGANFVNSLMKRWKSRNMDVDRMTILTHRESLADVLTIVQHADVLLDTFPFSGSTSHLECFSIGKVVVTLNGKDLRGSLCTGVYRRLGIHNAPIAYTISEYVNLAVQIANDENTRMSLEKQILDAMENFYESKEEIQEWNELCMSLANLRYL